MNNQLPEDAMHGALMTINGVQYIYIVNNWIELNSNFIYTVAEK